MKRFLSIVCAIAVIVVSFPVTVNAATDASSYTNLWSMDWTPFVSNGQKPVGWEWTVGSNKGDNGLLALTSSGEYQFYLSTQSDSISNNNHMLKLRSRQGAAMGFGSTLVDKFSKTPVVWKSIAKAANSRITDTSFSPSLAYISTADILEELSSKWGVKIAQGSDDYVRIMNASTATVVRDYSIFVMLRCSNVYDGLLKSKDVAALEILKNQLNDISVKDTNYFTPIVSKVGSIVPATCTKMSELITAITVFEDSIKSGQTNSDQANNVDTGKSTGDLYGDTYNLFYDYCANENGATVSTDNVTANLGLTKGTSLNDSMQNDATYKTVAAELTSSTHKMDSVTNTIAALYAMVLNKQGGYSKLGEDQQYELLSILYFRGRKIGLDINGDVWKLVEQKLHASDTLTQGAIDNMKAVADNLTDRINKLQKSKADTVTLAQKTAGPRGQVIYSMLTAKHDSALTISNLKISDVDSYTFGEDSKRGAESYFMMPEPTLFNSNNAELTKQTTKHSSFDFRTYVEMKDLMGELSALAVMVDTNLVPADLSTKSATTDEKTLFKIFDDIHQLITDTQSATDTGALKEEFNYYWNTAKMTGKQNKTLAEIYDALNGKIQAPSDEEFYQDTASEPLRNFINLSKSTVNAELITGMKLSATFIPFKTNVYDAANYRLVSEDDDFLKFHALYGYNRKALYIDTNVNAVTEYYNTSGKMGNKRVCTLKDLLECEKDIQLYTDDNFYNANKLEAYKSSVSNRLDNGDGTTDDNWWTKFWDNIGNNFKFDIVSVLKTGEKTDYANGLYGITSYGESKQDSYKQNDARELAVFNGKQIDSYINADDEDTTYNLMRSFAFTSAVYRSKSLFQLCGSEGVHPVFQSSKNAAGISHASTTIKDSLFNYALLKNIQSNRDVNYTSNLDYDKPVYMDVYGNILTETGYVVIPSAANATLFDDYSIYTAAWLSTYGQSYSIESTYTWPGESPAKGMMEINSSKPNVWSMDAKAVGNIDYNRLETSSDDTMTDLMTMAIDHINNNHLDFKNYTRNVFLEVMRGAPLEDIDKTAEALNVSMRVSRAGIIQAAKLDSLKNSLKSSSQNSVLALPNLAFMDGVEYAVLFIYKLALIICMLMLLFQIFLKAMRGQFGVKAVLSMFLTIAFAILAIFAIPKTFEISYYDSNKWLLQSESEEISMLNLEKKESGVEIGIADVGAPDISTKLYLKMKDVHVPWYDAFYKIITSPIDKTLTGIYKDYASTDPAMSESQFQFKNGGLYVPVDELYDSATVLFVPQFKSLVMTTTADTPASFYTPYYVFLQTLTTRVNNYNINQNVYSYSTATFSGGKQKSLGLSKDYFSSDYFIDKDSTNGISDILGLTSIYEQKTNTQTTESIFTPEEIAAMRKSQWLIDGIDDKQLNERKDLLDKAARDFVASHKSLIGRISDETFLKVMALDLSIKYNKYFNIGSADSVEIYNLSQDDLMRFSMATKEDVITGSPLSYTRFVYLNGGESAIYAAGLLEVVTFVSDWIKPIATLFIMLAMFISLFIYKIILGRKAESFRGYIVLMIALCSTNFLYSVLLKASLYLPNLHIAPTVCIIIQIVLQLILLSVFGYLTTIVVVNWRDLGSTKFTAMKLEIKHHLEKNRFMDAIREKGEKHKDDKNSGWRIYNAMHDSDIARKYNSIEEDDDI